MINIILKSEKPTSDPKLFFHSNLDWFNTFTKDREKPEKYYKNKSL